ncbi:MAG: metallophosphoesterase [Clostridia bacterium]|nr:metallophosphoesterase [Clostridia bacterium]
MNEISYLTDRYGEKIEEINDFGAPLNFVFITDMHNRLSCAPIPGGGDRLYGLAADHIASIQYILDRCPGISCVVCGGDIGNDYLSDGSAIRETYREVMDALYSLSVPAHCVVGNHDDATMMAEQQKDNSIAILPREMHGFCMKNNPTDENYYYADIDGTWRFIFINSCDRPYRIGDNGRFVQDYPLEISNEQAEWLEREALVTDRKIIVFSHAPISNEGVFGSVGKGGGYVRSHDDTLNSSRVYTALRECANVKVQICGHVHYDNLLYRDRMVIVSSLCSLVQEWAPSCPKRAFGTISETAFDVFSIKGDLMRITRFGAGYDRTATLLR